MEKETVLIEINDPKTLAEFITSILIEKKGLDVSLFYVGETNPIADYFILATGRSLTQVASLASEVSEKASEAGILSIRTEGKSGSDWILVDFGNVIVNIFDRSARELYNLDRYFSEDKKVDITELIALVDKKLQVKTEEEN